MAEIRELGVSEAVARTIHVTLAAETAEIKNPRTPTNL